MMRALIGAARLLMMIAAAVVCLNAPAQADDEWTAVAEADIAASATTGQQARDGIADRATKLHHAMACGNEFRFVRNFVLTKRLGKKGEDPNTALKESDFTSWPVGLMMGKAALLRDSSFNARATRSGGFVCNSKIGTQDEVKTAWAFLASDGIAREGESGEALVERIYTEAFGNPDDPKNNLCADVGSVDEGGGVFINLTRVCMARQIRVVMNEPRHGPWHEENGVVTPELPGTRANALPCLSEWTVGIDGTDGDWDMAVLDYTRLAHLLYGVEFRAFGVEHEITATLEVLNHRFLTLRSSPDQGATARESFNLATSCGNSPNQSGSAIDTVNGTGDEGLGRYNPDGKDALDGSTFWEDLLKFLAILAIIVAALVGAAIVGSIIGAAVGAGLGGAAAIAGVVGIIVVGSLFFGSIEETENHLLMQNSSRYLKNKLMMAELSEQGHEKEFNTIADLNEELREWLLKRMKRIADEDFVEYNSKPYARLSHFSLVNLLDFACDVQWDYKKAKAIRNTEEVCDAKDQAIVTAAAALMDLSSAKASVGSIGGRRLIPYRRLAVENKKYYDTKALTEMVSGADSMIGALQIWTGQMSYAPDRKVKPDTFGQLIYYSSSRYRPDQMILDIAVNKETSRQQQYRHWTREAYVSGNGWLITAGGTDERAAQGFSTPVGTIYNLAPTDDRGVGVPTTLMTDAITEETSETPTYSKVKDFLRFDGNELDWGADDKGHKYISYSNNNCIAGAFACGLKPKKPDGFDDATCAKAISDKFVAIDSTTCTAIGGSSPDAARGIYIALYDHDGDWGFFEVAERKAFTSIDEFIARVRDRNSANMDGWADQDADDEVTYVTTDGRELEFTPENEDFGADRRACGVVNSDEDSRFTISNVPASSASNCEPVGRRIRINLEDEKKPVRQAEQGDPLDELF